MCGVKFVPPRRKQGVMSSFWKDCPSLYASAVHSRATADILRVSSLEGRCEDTFRFMSSALGLRAYVPLCEDSSDGFQRAFSNAVQS